jgi:hypothetical protein
MSIAGQHDILLPELPILCTRSEPQPNRSYQASHHNSCLGILFSHLADLLPEMIPSISSANEVNFEQIRIKKDFVSRLTGSTK